MTMMPDTVARGFEQERQDADDVTQLAGLAAGDERAFATLVDRYHGGMLAIARTYGEDAPELVHQAWLEVMRACGSFDGSSSVRAWLVWHVSRLGEARATRDDDDSEAAVEPVRFRPEGTAFAGHWLAYPSDWRRRAGLLAADDMLDFVRHVVVSLPPSQRRVITLRDVERWSPAETRQALGISDPTQRELLHRARSRVRAALETRLDG